ncbi:MAG: winged helix-turn-helix transcriptional regulator [Phycisphaerales bacterium]|nr:winged helix-turn-helix transcriptional regulator [Phycisphaerales bacterium]
MYYPVTTDIFTAIAQPDRRAILELLATGTHPVGSIVEALQLPQPAVSKHLAILRKVNLVTVEKSGQHRLYRLNPQELQAVHAWIQTFERFWSHQVSRIKERAERLARAPKTS